MVTVVPFNGNDRFLIEETEFPLRKQTEACHEGRRARCLFPDKAVGIAVETVLVRCSQRAEYGTYLLLFGGREQPVSLARGVIVLSSHLSYHPFAESSRLLHRQLVDDSGKSFGKAHLGVGTIVFAFSLRLLGYVWYQHSDESLVGGQVFVSDVAQAGRSLRAAGHAMAESAGYYRVIEIFHGLCDWFSNCSKDTEKRVERQAESDVFQFYQVALHTISPECGVLIPKNYA